jgi:hypothetical protein
MTYGVFLCSCTEDGKHTLRCRLIGQRALRETVWHLHGAMRNALGQDEVDVVQTAMKIIPKECGVDVKSGMPRVWDVEDERRHRDGYFLPGSFWLTSVPSDSLGYNCQIAWHPFEQHCNVFICIIVIR